MGNRVTIITGQHLIFNPRVWKEANALCESGYNVAIFTTWYSSRYRKEDETLLNSSIAYLHSFSLIPTAEKSLSIFYARALKKVANLIFIIFRISSVYQLLYLPKRQLKCILSRPSDLFICHQEAGLLIGKELLKLGYKVAFDFEDWYSEDYLKLNRPRKLLQKAELLAIKQGCYITCPSKVMSEILEKKYGVAKRIMTIYNSFPIQDTIVGKEDKIPNSLVWFSQTIGPDRGIENFLFSIKNYETSINIHLIGKCSEEYKKLLFELIRNTSHSLQIHEVLNHNELMKYLKKFKVGLALENLYPLNKNLTISNKILTYLQLGLKVIATSTAGQLELKNTFKNQLKYIDIKDYKDIQSKLNDILFNNASNDLLPFPEQYTWEFQQEVILSLVNESVDI
ncbi:MAG: hypothetical protein ACK492_04895 [Chitinophagaceae bacterium]